MDEVGVLEAKPEGSRIGAPNRTAVWSRLGVANDNHWRWTLRSVERVGGHVGRRSRGLAVHYKNNASTARPLLLEDKFLETIVLIVNAGVKVHHWPA